jgi:hypothetical protein
MTTTTRAQASVRSAALTDPTYQAFLLLRTAFTLAPVVFGIDKFFNVLTNWTQYLAPTFNDLIPGNAHQAMLMIGVVEIAAGLLVALRPRIGGYVVAAWLAGIILNLLLIPGFYDVALRDFGLLVAALALARLAVLFPPTYARKAAQGPTS